MTAGAGACSGASAAGSACAGDDCANEDDVMQYTNDDPFVSGCKQLIVLPYKQHTQADKWKTNEPES